MLFNSIDFLFFFPLVTLLFFALPHRFRWLHLLLASCAFYMFFVPEYILILFFTILIDYAAGIWIEQAEAKNKRKYLIISLIANIGVLAIFKYYNFFIENINASVPFFNSASTLPYLKILLPIGLSFHTFQAMSYTIEVYRGNQKAERHLGIYALYVMFYPQLVAGPIERPQNILHQFYEVKRWDSGRFVEGLRLMLWGFFKKIVIADRLAIYVDGVYAQSATYGSPTLMLAAVLFSIQIYCDFSGYSDIAIGAARSMGFDLMVNFNRPYFATNIQQHWSRWHISLSSWFRDYVYIPLGGNRLGVARTYLNIATIFLLSGLWHGANWTYILWGGLHAALVVGYMFLVAQNIIKPNNNQVLNVLSALFTFAVLCLVFVFFRSNNIHQAVSILKQIFAFTPGLQLRITHGLNVFSSLSLLISAVAIAFMFIVEYLYEPKMLSLNKTPKADFAIAFICLTMILLWGVFNKNSFIYFQF